MSLWCRRCLWFLVAVTGSACGTHDVAVEFYLADAYHFSQTERREVQFSSPPWMRRYPQIHPVPPYGSRLINPSIANRIHRSFVAKPLPHPHLRIS
jgi:hypothetical protein